MASRYPRVWHSRSHPIRGLLDVVGVRFADASGTVLLTTYVWVTALIGYCVFVPEQSANPGAVRIRYWKPRRARRRAVSGLRRIVVCGGNGGLPLYGHSPPALRHSSQLFRLLGSASFFIGNSETMRAPAYLLTVAGTIVVLAAATIVFTVFVDPYRMFGTPSVPGLTALKPRAAEQMGIAKTYQLERVAPKTLLLGNSRTEIGLDPTSGQFPAEQRPVFNASYPGRDVCTSLLMLRDAIAVRIPDQVHSRDGFSGYAGAPGALSVSFWNVSQYSDLERRLLVDQIGHASIRNASGRCGAIE